MFGQKTKTTSVAWIYKFYFDSHLKKTKYNGVESIEKIYNNDELSRFNVLFNRKNYPPNFIETRLSSGELFDMFYREKIRLSLYNIQIDSLIDPHYNNPRLLSPQEVDDSYN